MPFAPVIDFFLDTRRNLLRIALVQIQRGAQNNFAPVPFLEYARPVPKLALGISALDRLQRLHIETLYADDAILDLSAKRAGISPNRAADRSRQSSGPFQSAQRTLDRELQHIADQ